MLCFEELKAYHLDFDDRVKCASLKNFQLVAVDDSKS